MISLVNSVFRHCLDALAPQRCIYCDEPTGAPLAICPVCQGELVPNREACPRCALPGCSGSLCPACLANPPPLASVTAPLSYDPGLAWLLSEWKYRRQQSLADTVATLMLSAPVQPPACDCVLPTPLHWTRQLTRGFNQSEDLLYALRKRQPSLHGSTSGGPVLRRRRRTAPQARATRGQRLRQLGDAFAVLGPARDRSILILDDVCTTGATGNAMAQALRNAGAREVHLWCLARTPSR